MRMLDNLYIKRTCPSCIQEFYPGDCEIVSTTTSGKVLEGPPRKGWQQHVARMFPKRLDGVYTLELACRKCPNCGYLLPPNVERVENINIAVVGDTSSGKSHYIAALIHLIQKGELQRADQYARFVCLTQDVEQEYRDNLLKPLFVDKQMLDFTQQAIDQNRAPLIYELILSPSPEHPARQINLIMYDVSGEDLAIRQRMMQFSRYVVNANAMIFLADPGSMPEIARQLPQFLQPRVITGRTSSSVFNSIIQLLESYRGLDSGARLENMPIAMTLSKSDLLKQLTPIQQQYSFLQKSSYGGSINLQDLDIINHEVRQLLEDYGELPLLQATRNFSRSRFFAVSATGYAPDVSGKYPAVEPYRCLEPLLWILYELDILHMV
ncbi:MAG TPA: hypothetical protein VFU49_17525 [Ktedonobacteraceae bacterium]|nr:hypothetical protein [Ktedonobacteraceae bacterium]